MGSRAEWAGHISVPRSVYIASSIDPCPGLQRHTPRFIRQLTLSLPTDGCRTKQMDRPRHVAVMTLTFGKLSGLCGTFWAAVVCQTLGNLLRQTNTCKVVPVCRVESGTRGGSNDVPSVAFLGSSE